MNNRTSAAYVPPLLLSLGAAAATLLASLLPALRSAAAEAAGPAGLLRAALAALRLPALGFAAAVFALCLAVSLSLLRGRSGWLLRLYRARYAVSAALLLACVALNLNNTSLFRWMMESGQPDADAFAPLWGLPRSIRSDEWAVWSAMTFAQASEGYPAVSSLIAGGGVPAVWVSVGGLPALSPAAVFKPLYWGFLLLGRDRGFSLLFALRILALFHVSHELALEYTGGSRTWSLTAAFLMTFSPLVQWWFSQSPAEILIFGQGLLLCLLRFLRAASRGRTAACWGWSLGGAWCLGCFALVSYVPWLVSGLWVLLPAAGVLLFRGRRSLRAREGAMLLLPCLLTAAVLFLLLRDTWPTLTAVRGSAYPGGRLITGGTPSPALTAGPGALLLPWLQRAGLNPSESAGFGLLPGCGFLLSAAGMLRKKRVDPISAALMAAEAVLALFAFVGFPAFLAKITLLSQVNRPELALGAADTVLLIRACAGGAGLPRKAVLPAAAGLALLWTLGARSALSVGWLPSLAAAALAGIVLLPLLSRKASPAAVWTLILFTALGGVFVNPLQQGLACVDQLETVRSLRACPPAEAGETEVWLAEGAWPETNLPLLAGKRTVGCTQPYPNPDFWAGVDPDGAYRDCYNRFANCSVVLTETEPTSFSVAVQDQLTIRLNPADLPVLGVTRLMTSRPLPDRFGPCVLELLGQDGAHYYYRVTPLAE